jgi:hypothetical protein
MDFPFLLSQFKEECVASQNEKGVDAWTDGISNLMGCLSISTNKYKTPDESFEAISSELNNLNKYSKPKIIEACLELFKWVNNLKEAYEDIKDENMNKTVESQLSIENIANDRDRIEANYNKVLYEHQSLEFSFKQLQQTHLQLEHQIRELNLSVAHYELQQDSLHKNIEELKNSLQEKDKTINELTRKLRSNKSLQIIKDMSQLDHANCNKQVQLQVSEKKVKTSSTPRAKRTFVFEKTPETEFIKDQVLKNLRQQLKESHQKNSILEQDVKKIEYKNQKLVEKIKLLNLQSFKYIEEDEEIARDSSKSLKDELDVLDSNPSSSKNSFIGAHHDKEKQLRDEFLEFTSKNKPPLLHTPKARDPKVKAKGRFSCFSFFG